MANTRFPSRTGSKVEGTNMLTTLEVPRKTAEGQATSPAPMTVETARAMIARADALPLYATEEEMKAIGYTQSEGGGWELPIPVSILRQL